MGWRSAILVIMLLGCSRPSGPPVTVTVVVRSGERITSLAETLAQRGVIRSRLRFGLLAWRNGYERRIVPGRYRLRTGSDERQVLRVLAREEPARLFVTIPEGLTREQTAARLAAAGLVDSAGFLAAAADSGLLGQFGIIAPNAEGYLFPETYEFSTAMTPTEIVAVFLRQFRHVMDSLVAADSLPKALSSEAAVVTLASIVEREARLPQEMALIAGVFVNRLHRGMLLQSCATVEYALGQHRSRLSDADLEVESPYNTYRHLGLPPGPICSPGRQALAAALRPARHDYLYFVSRGDGSHVFSTTFAEHAAAMRRLGF